MRFVEERSKQVAGPTVNRGIAVLSNMLTFALDKGYINTHPMQRFKRLPEPQTVLRVMTLEEERRLVEAVTAHHRVHRGYCALFGAKELPLLGKLRVSLEHISIP